VVNEPRTLVVAANEAGTRLDRWLVEKVPELGRKRAKQLCEAGHVTVDGRVGGKSLNLQAGSQVCFPMPAERRAVPNPSLVLDIRFENEFCVVVCKPAGLATAPLDEQDESALANALLARFPMMQKVGAGPLEPGIIHRLDNGTSGLVVAAKTSLAFDALRLALSKGELHKDYIAIVTDNDLPDQGSAAAHLRPDPHNTRRVVVAEPSAPGARAARTFFQVVERSNGFAVVNAQASRALRHQIRAHLSNLGCPLLNDSLYGGRAEPTLAPGRHALHARRVKWLGNQVMPAFDVVAPLPMDLLDLLSKLGFTRSLSL
jgi:23S rRNA pseudouridine1911/1915/1917 synthase